MAEGTKQIFASEMALFKSKYNSNRQRRKTLETMKKDHNVEFF